MRIHTDLLTASDLDMAARLAGVYFTRCKEYGSKKRARAFDVILSGSSTRRQNGGEEQAATWDEWGIFLAKLFSIDPLATSWAYRGAADFHHRTDDRFRGVFLPENERCQHRWRFAAIEVGFHVQACTRCGAVTRYPYATATAA